MSNNIIQFPSAGERRERAKALYNDIILDELSMHSEFLDNMWNHLDDMHDLFSGHQDFRVLYKGITQISIQTDSAVKKLQSQQKHSSLTSDS